MKKSTILSFLLMCIFCVSHANPFSVTLKVIDKTGGQITNNVNDQNEVNIFCWLDDNLKALNPTQPNEWWWPMYYDASSANYTNGLLVKGSDTWEWRLTIQVNPGTYKWNPYAKNTGWGPIRGDEANGKPIMYYYDGDDADNNLVFTVAADGKITGNTELIIDPNSQTKFSITLKIIDYTKGELTNAPGTWAEDANIIAWVTPSINPMFEKPHSGFWFYGFFDKTVNWENSGTMVTYPNGKLIKESDKWTWQATFEAAAGTYSWNPQSIVHGWASLTGGNVSFTVSATGELSGTYEIKLGGGDEGDIRVACIGDSNTAGAGVTNYLTKAWPVQMLDYLTDEYGTKNLGISGATLMAFPDPWGAWENNTSYVSSLKNYTPNIILIALGTNDSKDGYWGTRNFKQEYIEFINRYKAIETNPEIYMVMPIKALANGFGINNTNITDGVIPAIREISKEKMVPVIDWYSITSSATASWYDNDGVHANDETSRKMAEKAAQIILTQKPAIALNGTPSSTTYAEYRWYLNGALISGATTNTYQAAQAGTYNVAVKLTSNADDVIVSKAYQLAASSGTLVVSAEASGLDVAAYNNPAVAYENGAFIIENAQGANVSIYTITGKLVGKEMISSGYHTIAAGHLPSGIYICKFEKDSVSYIEKVIK